MSDATIPSSEQALSRDLARRIAAKRTEFLWLGIAMAVIGVLAIFFPVLTTLTVELMIGWVLVLAGLVHLFGSFNVEGTGAFFGTLLLSLLDLGIGVYLLTHPAMGMIVLTLLLAALFLVQGAVHISFSFDMRSGSGWGWVMLSGLVSIAAGLLIAGGLPGTSLFALGLLVGVTFLSTGIAFIVLSRQSVPEIAQSIASRTTTPGRSGM